MYQHQFITMQRIKYKLINNVFTIFSFYEVGKNSCVLEEKLGINKVQIITWNCLCHLHIVATLCIYLLNFTKIKDNIIFSRRKWYCRRYWIGSQASLPLPSLISLKVVIRGNLWVCKGCDSCSVGKESAKVPFKMTPASYHQTQNYDYGIGGGSKIKSEKSTWAKVNSKFELLLPKKTRGSLFFFCHQFES